MTSRRAQEQDDKRARILRAAVHAFSHHGYHQTRISDIAKAANVADGTVYLYFEGKREILSKIFEERMAASLERGREELRRIDGAVEKLRRLVELHLEDLGENPELATVFQIELRHSTGFMELYSRGELRDYFQLIAEILEQGQKEGCIRNDIDPWFATKCIFGVLDEAATNWILSKRNYRLRSSATQILDFILNGLSASPG
ncbi:MAG: TetR family transcriptional regulator [Acidobacteria bacterium]|nr:TetR family transcriptional regulator [Acidobacteriota bacterium]NIM63867.1 TetR family transcriptional regulator [Acidobacteriota bacterium]NIO60136.1 TetR family transcriptional regulator [Acidobacteriota bacterium]NIQ31200.1 TetR family transcriptional regulator [Acidobacteriota bacterium]NIQ86337.1 TetR family transcriptional regulator [Acidobacteriota bacterium]